MPLKLNVGVSKKVGLPEYSSAGASCHLEVELENGLLGDPEGLHERVRDAYVACRQAVDDELARFQPNPAPSAAGVARTAEGRNGHKGPPPWSEPPRNRPARPATASQVRALSTLARSRRADLAGLLRDGYGVDRPEGLSLAQASGLIDRLKAGAAV